MAIICTKWFETHVKMCSKQTIWLFQVPTGLQKHITIALKLIFVR